MILPIRIYTTPESLLIIRICLPVWFSLRLGFKPTYTVRDRWFAPRMSCSQGEDKMCIHAYILGCTFRWRKYSSPAAPRGTKRFLFSVNIGWGQVFESGIL